MVRGNAWFMWWSAVAVAISITACTRQEQAAAPSIELKTFALKPASAPVKIAFLTGELKDLKVTERVEQGSGTAVEPPRLRATLKVKNVSPDQAIRLISGRIEYADAAGNAIQLAEGRGGASFKFYAYQQDRLDPGMETSQDIDVPFPAAALKEKKLGDIRLELSYIPTAYRIEAAKIPLSLEE